MLDLILLSDISFLNIWNRSKNSTSTGQPMDADNFRAFSRVGAFRPFSQCAIWLGDDRPINLSTSLIRNFLFLRYHRI